LLGHKAMLDKSYDRMHEPLDHRKITIKSGCKIHFPIPVRAMSTIAKLTVDQYDRMIAAGIFDDQQRVELIHGELRDMTPIGPEHEIAVDKLNEWSIETLPKKKVWVRVQNSVGIAELDSAPEPDIAWVARRDYRTGRPTSSDVLLIIEVSASSLAFDRGEKSELYAAAGIQEYWIANLTDQCLEVYREPSQGKYQSVITYRGATNISPLAFPTILLSVKQIFERE
jgi:Uma2 family endonuclease